MVTSRCQDYPSPDKMLEDVVMNIQEGGICKHFEDQRCAELGQHKDADLAGTGGAYLSRLDWLPLIFCSRPPPRVNIGIMNRGDTDVAKHVICFRRHLTCWA